MERPAALLGAIQQFCESIDQEAPFLTTPLAELTRDLKIAVDTYVGVEVTVFTEVGLPVTLSDFAPDADLSEIRTSLRLSLAELTSLEAPGHVTFYGGRRGAFVDLAADLEFALRAHDPDGTRPPADIRLDQHLQPASTQARLVGAEEASTVNRAIGLLIGRGRSPGQAQSELVLGAQQAGTTVAAYAQEILRQAQPTED